MMKSLLKMKIFFSNSSPSLLAQSLIAEVTISKLTEEKSSSIQDIRVFQEKLAELSKRGVRRGQVGFPLLFVCMVAIVSVELGYLLHR
nr:vesicle-associated protein 2-2-like [Quercus suber]